MSDNELKHMPVAVQEALNTSHGIINSDTFAQLPQEDKNQMRRDEVQGQFTSSVLAGRGVEPTIADVTIADVENTDPVQQGLNVVKPRSFGR